MELVSNVFVTGGCATFPGLIQRLQRELLEMRPFQSSFHVSVAQEPGLSAWRGARKAALSPHFKEMLLTRAEYDEKGPDFFKVHPASNMYYPTPKALPVHLKEALQGQPVRVVNSYD